MAVNLDVTLDLDEASRATNDFQVQVSAAISQAFAPLDSSAADAADSFAALSKDASTSLRKIEASAKETGESLKTGLNFERVKSGLEGVKQLADIAKRELAGSLTDVQEKLVEDVSLAVELGEAGYKIAGPWGAAAGAILGAVKGVYDYNRGIDAAAAGLEGLVLRAGLLAQITVKQTEAAREGLDALADSFTEVSPLAEFLGQDLEKLSGKDLEEEFHTAAVAVSDLTKGIKTLKEESHTAGEERRAEIEAEIKAKGAERLATQAFGESVLAEEKSRAKESAAARKAAGKEAAAAEKKFAEELTAALAEERDKQQEKLDASYDAELEATAARWQAEADLAATAAIADDEAFKRSVEASEKKLAQEEETRAQLAAIAASVVETQQESLAAQAQALEYYKDRASAALQPLADIAGSVFGSITKNIEEGNRAFAGFGKAVKSGVAEALKSLGKRFGVEALGELAAGIAALASVVLAPTAPGHFAAAAVYGAAAVAAGVGGALLSRGAGGASGAGPSGGRGRGGAGGGGAPPLTRVEPQGPTELAPVIIYLGPQSGTTMIAGASEDSQAEVGFAIKRALDAAGRAGPVLIKR